MTVTPGEPVEGPASVGTDSKTWTHNRQGQNEGLGRRGGTDLREGGGRSAAVKAAGWHLQEGSARHRTVV